MRAKARLLMMELFVTVKVAFILEHFTTVITQLVSELGGYKLNFKLEPPSHVNGIRCTKSHLNINLMWGWLLVLEILTVNFTIIYVSYSQLSQQFVFGLCFFSSWYFKSLQLANILRHLHIHIVLHNECFYHGFSNRYYWMTCPHIDCTQKCPLL